MGRTEERRTAEILEAVNSLLTQIDQDFDSLATEYGVSVPLHDPSLRVPGAYEDPSVYVGYGPLSIWWSSFFAGLRFPDDVHLYTLWASFGILDLIKHEPATGDEIGRSDIRSCKTLQPTNTAEIRIFRNTRNLSPLRDGLVKLRDLLQATTDETVNMVTNSESTGYLPPEVVIPDEFRTPCGSPASLDCSNEVRTFPAEVGKKKQTKSP